VKAIEGIEKYLDGNRKLLLYSLREKDWEIEGIEDDISDWALDQKWLIVSGKQNRGFSILLMLYKYDGEYDGMNRVVATTDMNAEIDPYGGDPSLEFDKPKFSNNLESFLWNLHEMRVGV
jgi:hypothetical protein